MELYGLVAQFGERAAEILPFDLDGDSKVTPEEMEAAHAELLGEVIFKK